MRGITLHEVKRDISNGHSDKIYFSKNHLWWTHQFKDVKEATLKGRGILIKRLEIRLNAETVTCHDHKEITETIYNLKNESTLPLDAKGSVLYEYTNVKKWISDAEKNPSDFGDNGLDAFIFCHHQNNDDWCSKSWKDLNNFMDVKKMLKH